MKKVLALGLLVFLVFVVVHRQRLFLRDPLASVTRDGVKVDGVRVMINYSNDVLLEDPTAGHRRMYLIQNWNKVAETPTAPLRCLQGLACLTDADEAAGAVLVPGTRGRRSPFEGVTMTNKRVEFVDEDGALVGVTLF
jgi:hypothetical protein